jgi:hypothetical protein
MGMFTDLIEADKPKLFAINEAAHNKLVAEASFRDAVLASFGKNNYYRIYRLACNHLQEIQKTHMRSGSFKCKTCFNQKLNEDAKIRNAAIDGEGKNKGYRSYKLACGHSQQIETGKMRRGGFKCKICLDKKLNEEAKIRNAVIDGEGKDRNYRSYRLACGHSQQIQMGDMRKGNFKCRTCLDKKLNEEANARNAVIDGEGKDKNHRSYKLSCGHSQQIPMSKMRSGVFKCKTCFENKLTQEALSRNAKIDGKGKNNQSRSYQLACGHLQNIPMANMRSGGFKCKTCFENKLKEEANIFGAVIDRKGKNAHLLWYKLSCGHHQEVHISSMRSGIFVCQTCEDTWATKPSNVYVHSISIKGKTIIKIGRAQNVERRIKGYGLPAEAIVKTFLELPTKTGKDAGDIEIKVLKKFKPYRVKNIGHIMTKSGATECFDVSKLSEILDFTKSLAEVK